MFTLSTNIDNAIGQFPPPTAAAIWDPLVRELDEKDRAIANLQQNLAHTRDCIEIARKALQSVADGNGHSRSHENHMRTSEIALNALNRI
jgi:hypothetical protein